MGLLNNILRSVVKDAVGNVLEQEIKKAVNTPAQNNTQSTGTQQPSAAQSAAAPLCIQTVSVEKPDLPARQVEYELYDTDEGGNEIILVNTLMLENGYHEMDSGAGEIDFSAIYDDSIPADEYADYDSSKPALTTGEAYRPVAAAISEYEKNKKQKQGCTIQLVSGGKYSYKVKAPLGDKTIAAYCFKKHESDNYYCQLAVEYPNRLAGSDREKRLMQGLDLAAATFETKIKN